jgi:hypothetical protein
MIATTNETALSVFFENVIKGIKEDAESKNQKIPVNSFDHVQSDSGGQLFAADYFKYLVYGRGPGKMPPPDNIEDWVKKNIPGAPFKSAAYAIGLKIAREGTDIYQGKKPGVDFLGVVEENMVPLLEQIGFNEAMSFVTSLKTEIK